MKIRRAEISDIGNVAKLVRSLSHYYLDGDQEELPQWFNNTILDSSFYDRFESTEYHNYVADDGGFVVGYISIKNGFHLYHLFVSPNYHNQGIAKSLWHTCINELGISHCTVRSSLYAVPVYSNFGFKAASDATYKDGIGFQTMRYSKANC